jgi:hypothetical protein
LIEKFESKDFFIVSGGLLPLPSLFIKADNRDEAISIAIEVWKEQGFNVAITKKKEIIATPLIVFLRKEGK